MDDDNFLRFRLVFVFVFLYFSFGGAAKKGPKFWEGTPKKFGYRFRSSRIPRIDLGINVTISVVV